MCLLLCGKYRATNVETKECYVALNVIYYGMLGTFVLSFSLVTPLHLPLQSIDTFRFPLFWLLYLFLFFLFLFFFVHLLTFVLRYCTLECRRKLNPFHKRILITFILFSLVHLLHPSHIRFTVKLWMVKGVFYFFIIVNQFYLLLLFETVASS